MALKSGDSRIHEFYVTNSSGTAVTGLVSGDFTHNVFKDGASHTPATDTFAEVGSGWYKYTWSLTEGQFTSQVLAAAPSTHYIDGDYEALHVEANNLDDIHAAAVRPTSVTSATGAPDVETTLTFDANRYHEVTLTAQNNDGSVRDLSGYNNFVFTVWDDTHSGGAGAFYTLSSGITGSALGVVSFSVPETAAFFTQIDDDITNDGKESITLRYDLKGDQDSDTTKTRNIFRGPLVLRRYEGSA